MDVQSLRAESAPAPSTRMSASFGNIREVSLSLVGGRHGQWKIHPEIAHPKVCFRFIPRTFARCFWFSEHRNRSGPEVKLTRTDSKFAGLRNNATFKNEGFCLCDVLSPDFLGLG